MPDREKSNWAIPDSDPELQLLIRNATATYGKPASNPDLAQRILSRIGAENTATSTRKWLPWAAAFPIAACLITLFLLFAPRPTHKSSGQSEQAHISAQPPNRAGSDKAFGDPENAQVSPARSSRPRADKRSIASNKQSLPRLETFPAPQALTPEEQAMATYAAHAPEEERQALIEAHERLETPLTIAVITIQPLEPAGPGGN
jgi:hypothetical protein